MQTSNYTLAGWRGGIGIAFGLPAKNIPDVLELGYEIAWGGESNPHAAEAAGISLFMYWNSIVEISLKDASGAYDFSAMADKQKAAECAFDAFGEKNYGTKGLSRFAQVRHAPEAVYGDVYGTMDLTAANPLVEAVINSRLKWFEEQGVTRGGVALDNAGKIPETFLRQLRARLTARGLGIAANGCPDAYLKYIDFFGKEGFRFTVQSAREAQTKGFNGILAEFTRQHLSAGELELYLTTRLFNRIVFFGYTNGGTAMGAGYSFYSFRPDVYHHQRWVFRKYVPLSRALCRAGIQSETHAVLAGIAGASPVHAAGAPEAEVNEEGKVYEYKGPGLVDVRDMVQGSTGGRFVAQYGARADAGGVYLYVNSMTAEDVACDAVALGITGHPIVYDEFNRIILGHVYDDQRLSFRTRTGPALVQVGSVETVVRNILARIGDSLEHQLRQRCLDRHNEIDSALKHWAVFCRGYELDETVKRSGQSSLKTTGGKYQLSQWSFFIRQGAAQLVNINQSAPEALCLTAYSRCCGIARSDKIDLNDVPARMEHFDSREAYRYAVHLYLDYQDGAWPEVHTAYFSPGTRDWEQVTLRVVPKKAVATALVLIEFHQPEGSAWFDDLTLAAEARPAENLLACPGFEKHQPTTGTPAEFNDRYESVVRELIAMTREPITAGRLSAMQKLVMRQEKVIAESGMRFYCSYEMRDIADSRDRLEECRTLLDCASR